MIESRASRTGRTLRRLAVAALMPVGLLWGATIGASGAALALHSPRPAGCSAQYAAVVTQTSNTVQVKEGTKAWTRAKAGTKIRAKDQVRTRGQSRASLTLCAGGSMFLNNQTDVALQNSRVSQIRSGEADVVFSDPRDQIKAKRATATMNGSHRVNVDVRVTGRHAVITGVEGATQVRTVGGTVTLAVNQQTSVTGTHAPLQPVTVNAAAATTWTSRFVWSIVARFGDPKPTRMTTDSQGNLYVTEEYQAQVVKLSPGGNVITAWSTKIDQSPSLPQGIALDPAGNVYVADAAGERIIKFSPAGQVLAAWGSYGSDPGKFNYPEGIALDSAGNMYVADTGNMRVQKLSPSGAPLGQWGNPGTDLGQFRSPSAIALDGSGNVYVSDWGDAFSPDRLIKIAPSGRFLSQWSAPMPDPSTGVRNTPSDLAVDAQGDVYVAEAGSARLIEFSSADGRILGILGTFGTALGQFQYGEPTGITLDARGNLYTADENLHRILRYSTGS